MNKASGFTLLELMLTISIVAVLVTIGVPGMQQMMRANVRASSSNELISTINQTRSEAVKRNTSVSLCPSTNGTSCTGGTSWSSGWIAFVDDDFDGAVETSDGNGTWNTGEEILTTVDAISNTTINGTFTAITYRPNGRMRTSASAEQAEFVLCDDQGVGDASVVLIWISGRPQASDTDLNNAAPSTCTPS